MSRDFFPTVSRSVYEGPRSRNSFAFKHYHPDEMVEGKSMRDHLRFAAAYWHIMRNPLADPFGVGTALMPSDDGTDSVANAQKRLRAGRFKKSNGHGRLCSENYYTGTVEIAAVAPATPHDFDMRTPRRTVECQ